MFLLDFAGGFGMLLSSYTACFNAEPLKEMSLLVLMSEVLIEARGIDGLKVWILELTWLYLSLVELFGLSSFLDDCRRLILVLFLVSLSLIGGLFY